MDNFFQLLSHIHSILERLRPQDAQRARLEKKSRKRTELCFLAGKLSPAWHPDRLCHGPRPGSRLVDHARIRLPTCAALGRVMIEGDLPGMHMGLQELFGVAISTQQKNDEAPFFVYLFVFLQHTLTGRAC